MINTKVKDIISNINNTSWNRHQYSIKSNFNHYLLCDLYPVCAKFTFVSITFECQNWATEAKENVDWMFLSTFGKIKATCPSIK